MFKVCGMTASAQQVRVNISISSDIHTLGKIMARTDHRDFSNQIEALIEDEARRRGIQELTQVLNQEVTA